MTIEQSPNYIAECRARRAKIAETIKASSKSYREIAKDEGVSRQRVGQIAKEFKVQRRVKPST